MQLRSFGAACLVLAAAVGAQTPQPQPGTAAAPPPPAARGPSLAVALELVQRALAACAADQLNVNALVTDSAGSVKVSMLADGARGMMPEFGARKARTALEFKLNSGEVAKLVAANDEAVKARLADNKSLFAAAGAVLLKSGAEIIGVLAVSGAKSEQDEACALAAIAPMKERIQ
jgi:uncharacterized protein GlcG (DUF336 family)